MTPLLQDLADALSALTDFKDSDGNLIRSRIEQRAIELDPAFLKAILEVPSLRTAFFRDIEGTMVFDKARLVQAVTTRDFLPDSFTAYGNRIGLTVEGEALRRGRDVVLDWPYKDCVLAGGMTREDRGGAERFVNRIVAPDEVLRLEEPKALTRWERWDADAVMADAPARVEGVTGRENLLLKGNNLFALHSLKTHLGSRVATEGVKLIYIDPPYNTGNDGFRYNDRFTHSTWLTFMRNRLEVARDLLREDGAIFVNLDDTEVHYARVMADEVFGRENFVAHISWQKRTSPDARVVLGNQADHLLVYGRKTGTTKRANGTSKTLFEDNANKLPLTDKQLAEYKNPDRDPKGRWVHRDFTAQNKPKNGKVGRQNQVYPIIGPTGESFCPGTGYCWKVVEAEYEELLKDGRIWFGIDGSNKPRRKQYLSEETGVQSSTWWPHDVAGTN